MTMTPQAGGPARSAITAFPLQATGNREDVARSLIDFSGLFTASPRSAGNKRRFSTIFGPLRPARVLAPAEPMWQEPAA
jgi:hypothetical protein